MIGRWRFAASGGRKAYHATMIGWFIIPSWYLVMSVATFIIYWRDKFAAERGSWRVKERTLHIWSLLGGWPGAIVAIQLLQHKSRKIGFRLILGTVVVLHIVLWGLVVWSRMI